MSDSGGAIPVVIGVDIGGTNTDVAILHKKDGTYHVLADVKELTSNDVNTGVQKAVLRALLQLKDKGVLVSPIQINIGTTHFVNAVVQGKDLTKVAVLRICGPVSKELPPFCDFPSRLANIICGSVHFIHGGVKFDGLEHEALDKNEILQLVHEIRDRGIKNIVIVGVFSPTYPDQELKAGEIVLDEFPTASVSLSHEIGHIGLLERENATILNECLKPLCKKTVTGFASVLEEIGVTCPLYLSQNDGTIISSTDVLKYPVFTIASGPTNSMRGAAFLSENKDAIVVDIGGTTTDVGVLKGGFPREKAMHFKIGGVRTHFRCPDIISVGLGGGSYVKEQRSSDGTAGVKVGPLSAGLRLQREAFVFAEDNNLDERSMTATDIAVAAGLCNLGCKDRVKAIDSAIVSTAVEEIHKMVEDLVDKIKFSKEKLPLIIVGGGSVLIDVKRSFKGAAGLIVPKYFGVANAIGAALRKVAVRSIVAVNLLDLIDVDEMEQAEARARAENFRKTDPKELDFAMKEARHFYTSKARAQAIEGITNKTKAAVITKGGHANSLEILEKEAVTLSHLPGDVIEIKVRVVGDFEFRCQEADCDSWVFWGAPEDAKRILSQESVYIEKQTVSSIGLCIDCTQDDRTDWDAKLYPKEPTIDAANGEWILSEWDVECIAVGAGIYGCGGGASPHIGRLRALKSIRDGKKVRVVTPERLLRGDSNNIIIGAAFLGAPLIMYEQGVSSSETTKALECLRDVYEIGNYKDGTLQNREGVVIERNASGVRYIRNYQPSCQERVGDFKVVGMMPVEIAGLNALEPFIIAANLDLPIIDADGMSRAFPEIQMFLPYVYDKAPYPVSIVGSGNCKERSVLLQCSHNKMLENYLRNISIKNGSSSGIALPLDRDEVLQKTALHTVSRAWRLGNAILRARLEKESVIDTIIKREDAKHIITGKITNLQREITGGFNRGFFTVEAIDDWEGKDILIEFQNENLVVIALENGKRGECLGTVPDLIAVVDADIAEPVTNEELKCGLRVAVLLMPSHNLLREPKALKWVGPQAFHYPETIEFTPYKERLVTNPIPPI